MLFRSLYGDSPLRVELPDSVIAIDDCAQALGAGTTGRTATVSFYPTKNLGALGDGGAILTRDREVAARARRLRDYGQESKYQHVEVGYNSRLDEIQAAILNTALMPRLADWNYRRNEIARLYCDATTNPAVTIPSQAAGHLWHLFPVLVENREAFEAHMLSRNIPCGRHYPFVIPELPALGGRSFEVLGELPNARRFANQEVSLPIDPYMLAGEIVAVIDAVNSF